MPISITCPNNHKLNVPDTLSGKKVKCPKCGGIVMVGALSDDPSSTPPARSTKPAAGPNPIKPKTPATQPLDPITDGIDPRVDPFSDSGISADPFGLSNIPAFPSSPAALQPTSTRGSTQPIKSKAQPKGYIWDSVLLSLAVSVGLFIGIVSGGSLLAMFKFDFSNGKATAARGNNNSIESTGNRNSNLDANAKPQRANLPQTPNPQAPNPQAPNTQAPNTQAPNTQASAKSDLDSLTAEQKKKLNVFGYDINQRTALANFLSENNISKIKANASVMIVAGKLLKAANGMEMKPDENNVIAFPTGTNFERMFNDGSLIEEVDIAALPEAFVPLIAKYSKGDAAPDEKQLAFYVLAAFYLSEVK